MILRKWNFKIGGKRKTLILGGFYSALIVLFTMTTISCQKIPVSKTENNHDDQIQRSYELMNEGKVEEALELLNKDQIGKNPTRERQLALAAAYMMKAKLSLKMYLELADYYKDGEVWEKNQTNDPQVFLDNYRMGSGVRDSVDTLLKVIHFVNQLIYWARESLKIPNILDRDENYLRLAIHSLKLIPQPTQGDFFLMAILELTLLKYNMNSEVYLTGISEGESTGTLNFLNDLEIIVIDLQNGFRSQDKASRSLLTFHQNILTTRTRILKGQVDLDSWIDFLDRFRFIRGN